jgi:membrane protein DedA with SNARE-associated domain
VVEVPFRRYTILTAIGSAIWCFVLAGVGWALGASWSKAHHDFRYLDYLVAAGLAILIAVWVVRRRRSPTLRGRGPDSPR